MSKKRRRNKRPKCTVFRTPSEHRAATAHLKVSVSIHIEPIEFTPANWETRAGILRYLGYSSYQDYLNSPLWYDIRHRVMKRARGRCEFCGRRASQVHHEAYSVENLEGRSLLGLYAICRRCHEKKHGIR